MLRCKASYADICTVDEVKMVGNSLVAWPNALQNCKRLPHPQRDSKPFLRDKIICRNSNGHIGNVQNNLDIGDYKGKHVALFRAVDTVLDCGQGTIIDFPSWKALREMLGTKAAEVSLSVSMLLRLAGDAEEEVAAGLAEEVTVPGGTDGGAPAGAAQVRAGKRPHDEQDMSIAAEMAAMAQAAAALRAAKKPKVEEEDLEAWKTEDMGEYPNAIHLVTSTKSDKYIQMIQECTTATTIGYDAQWSPDFEEGTDNPIALLQMAFPLSGNTYVLQLPLLGLKWPAEVKRLFENKNVTVVGFAANTTDVHKFEVSGVNIDQASLIDVQPWCEAEMGENASVKQGWRVGLKRATWCVLDFEMDKTSTVASSNWEREELTSAQVEYAAMDVWVALRLYQRLLDVGYTKPA